MPRVSVVIPSYNHAKYVGQSITSVIEQSFSDFEIVITDDGSSDDTVRRICEHRDPRIDFEMFPENLGAGVATNSAIRRSRGPYIALLNSDDFFLPDKLERQVAFLDNHPEVGAVFGMPAFIDERGSPLPNHPSAQVFRGVTNANRYEWLRRFFFQGNQLCHPSIMIRRECYDRVGLYDPRLAQLPDLDMWVRLCKEFEIHVMPIELVCFRIRDNALNASAPRPDAIIQHVWERRQLLRHYLDLDRDSFQLIFPESAKSPRRRSVNESICDLALEVGTPYHAAFALETLHRELASEDDETRYRDLIRLTGEIDIYNQCSSDAD